MTSRQARLSLSPYVLALSAITTLPVSAAITGTVVADATSQPIAGARVRLQATDSPLAITNASGQFTLNVTPSGTVKVTAAVTYDATAGTNYTTGGVNANNGNVVQIRLEAMPTAANTNYEPIQAATPGGCGDCHSEHLGTWSTSNHAGAATDTWVRDLFSGDGTPGGAAGYVYKNVHPGETGWCATCHTPVAEAHAPGTIMLDQVTSTSALEGVNCAACHQLDAVSSNVEALHLVGSPAGATFRFPLAGVGGSSTHEYVWGPLDDVDYPFMKASHGPFMSSPLLCASCHQYENPTTHAPGQSTYSEWLASPYSIEGSGYRSCQSCHMPTATTAGPVADPVIGSAPTRPATQRHEHSFVGATPTTLAQAVSVAATSSVSHGTLVVEASVTNVGAGHAFPTGISIRNAILLVQVTRNGVRLTQSAGPTVPWWADDEVAGTQAGDWSGWPGLGFAKILQGTVSGVVTKPVLFVDADTVVENTLLAAGATATADLAFPLPANSQVGDVIAVEVSLLYRRAFRALAVTKGWTTTPQGGAIETEVAHLSRGVTLTANDLVLQADGFESGTAAGWGQAVQ